MSNKIKYMVNVFILLVFCFCISVLLRSIYNTYSTPENDFIIYQSFKTSFNNGCTCDIKVIVNKKNYDKDEMCDIIRSEYNDLNGEPDRLNMTLYNSKNDFENFNVAYERTYYKYTPDNIFLNSN